MLTFHSVKHFFFSFSLGKVLLIKSRVAGTCRDSQSNTPNGMGSIGFVLEICADMAMFFVNHIVSLSNI